MEIRISSQAFDFELQPTDLTKKVRPSRPLAKLVSSLCALALAAVMVSMTETESVNSPNQSTQSMDHTASVIIQTNGMEMF